MLARACTCERPRVFADEPDTCHRCGYAPPPVRIYPSTRRLAMAIAAVLCGQRRMTLRRHQKPRSTRK